MNFKVFLLLILMIIIAESSFISTLGDYVKEAIGVGDKVVHFVKHQLDDMKDITKRIIGTGFCSLKLVIGEGELEASEVLKDLAKSSSKCLFTNFDEELEIIHKSNDEIESSILITCVLMSCLQDTCSGGLGTVAAYGLDYCYDKLSDPKLKISQTKVFVTCRRTTLNVHGQMSEDLGVNNIDLTGFGFNYVTTGTPYYLMQNPQVSFYTTDDPSKVVNVAKFMYGDLNTDVVMYVDESIVPWDMVSPQNYYYDGKYDYICTSIMNTSIIVTNDANKVTIMYEILILSLFLILLLQ